MLKSIYKILLLLFVASHAYGQEKGFLPKSFSANVELGNFLYSRIIDNVDFKEVTADLQIRNFLLVADYGYAGFSQNEQYHNYFGEGNYFRVGADYNIIEKPNNPNIIFFGLRYAWVKFDESVDYSSYNAIIRSNTWAENTLSIDKEDVSGRWLEMVTGIKVDVYKGFQLGFTARYKFLASVDAQGTFANYYLPGYGKRILSKNSAWGISYYVGYRFRFKK